MSQLPSLQEHFKDLPPASSELPCDIFPSVPFPPTLENLSGEVGLLRQELFCSVTDFDVENADLKCDILRKEKELSNLTVQLNLVKSNLSISEENFRIECQRREELDGKYQHELSTTLHTLKSCQLELDKTKEKYEETCQTQQGIQQLYDSLKAKHELASTESQKKEDVLELKLREKDIDCVKLEKKLGEISSEKSIVEESFRLFKNSILNDVGGDSTSESNLTTKIRILQEANAELSANNKNLNRKLAESDVMVAAAKEEIALSDRLKSRLSSTVDNQSQQLDTLEKKFFDVKNSLVLEQQSKQEVEASKRALELETIQHKFTIERLEKVIVNLKEDKDNLKKDISEQIEENKKWIERLKNSKKDASKDYDNHLQVEQQKRSALEKEFSDMRIILTTTEASLGTANVENDRLRKKVSSLEKQVEHVAELEVCIADMQQELENKEDEIATLCGAFEKRGESLKELEKRISLQASEMSFLRPDRESKAKAAKYYEEQISALQTENANLRRIANQNESRGSIIDELKMTIMQYEQKLKNIVDDKEQLEAVNRDLDSLKTNYRALKDDYEEAEETMLELSKTAADEIEQREQRITSLEEEVEKLTRRKNELKEKVSELQEQNAKHVQKESSSWL